MCFFIAIYEILFIRIIYLLNTKLGQRKNAKKILAQRKARKERKAKKNIFLLTISVES